MLPMRRAKIKRAGKSERGAEDAAIAGADFMLSIVDAHHTRGNGNVIKMDSGQKAREAKQRVYRNFGMPHPEGYRKALRVMKIAEKFKRPIFTLVDTDGAYPGLHAEERGQGEAIARNLLEMARLETPIVATVIGVGGSGGAPSIAPGPRAWV